MATRVSLVFASYMAVSACRSNSVSRAVGEVSATPTLADGDSIASSNATGAAMRSATCSAMTRALFCRVEVGQQDGELVAAEARDGCLGRHALAQAVRDDEQQPIADLVAERVVDLFEAVEVEQQDRRHRVRVREHRIDPVGQVHSVRQSGQRVMCRVVAEPLDKTGALDRHREVPGQRLQQGEVVGGERGDLAEPVGRRSRCRPTRSTPGTRPPWHRAVRAP